MTDQTTRHRQSRVALACAVTTACLLAGGCAKQSTSTPAASVSAYQPTATFQEVMDSVVDPSADFIWQAVSAISDAKGFHERQPQTAAEWHEVRQHAIVLVEAANLIAVPGRRVAKGTTTVEDGGALEVDKVQQRLDSQHEQLVGFASALRDIGLKLVDDADRQDAAAITEHGGTLDEVCEGCHKVFWYPEAAPPGTNRP